MSGLTKAFASNVIWTAILQVVTILGGFITPIAIITAYGSDTNGLVTSLTQFISYFALAEAGVSAAAVFALYRPLASRDTYEIGKIASAARVFYYKAGGIFVGLVIALALVYPSITTGIPIDNMRTTLLVLALGLGGCVKLFISGKYRVLLLASQRGWVIQITSIVCKVMEIATIVVMSSMAFPIEVVCVSYNSLFVLQAVMLTVYTRSKFKDIDFACKEKAPLPQRWDAFYLQVLGVVQRGAPIIIATFVLQDLKLVSVFSIYTMIANGLSSFCTVMTNGTQAVFGSILTTGDKQAIDASYGKLQALVYSVNAASAGVALAAIIPFVTLYIGAKSDVNYIYPLLGALFVMSTFTTHLKTPQGLMVVAAGHYKQTKIQTTLQAVILIVCGVVGGLLFGMEGIIAGSIISNIYRTVDLALYVPKHIIDVSPKETIKKIAVCVLNMLVCALPLVPLFGMADSWTTLIVFCALGIVWSAIVVLGSGMVFYRKDILAVFGKKPREEK